MKSRIVLTLVCAGILAVVTACGASSQSGGDSGKTSIVAAFYPLSYAAEEIGQSTVTVQNLTPAGTEPHDLELRPGDVSDLLRAELVLYLGRGFQPAVETIVERRKGPSLDLLEQHEGLGRLRPSDPHIWLDPPRYAAMARTIGRALHRPQEGREFASRALALGREYRRGLAHCRSRAIVTSHAAFGYLAERYGLRQVPLEGIQPEAEPSPRAVQRLVAEVGRVHATAVFSETLVSPKLAQTVAREAGVGTAVLDPIEGLTKAELDRGESYFTVMRANLRALRKALSCR